MTNFGSYVVVALQEKIIAMKHTISWLQERLIEKDQLIEKLKAEVEQLKHDNAARL